MSRPRPKRPFHKVPEFLSLPTDKVPLSQDNAGSRSSNRGRNPRTRGNSPRPRDGSAGYVHRSNRGSLPDSPRNASTPLSARIPLDSPDMRREIDNLVEHVRAVAMDNTPSTSGGGHFDWAGDEDDSLPDLDDWGVTTANAGLKDEPKVGEGSKPLYDPVEDVPSSPVVSKSVDLYDVAPPITMTVDSSLDSDDPFSEQSIVPKVSLPAHRRVPTRLEGNLLKHSHPLRQIDPTTIPLLEHDPSNKTLSLDNASYSVLLPTCTSQCGQPAVSPPSLRIKERRDITADDDVTGEDISAALEASNEIYAQPAKGYQMVVSQYLHPELEPTRTDDFQTLIHFPETRFTSEFDRLSASQAPPHSSRRHDDRHPLPASATFLPPRLSRSRSPTPHRTFSPSHLGRHVRTHSSPQPGVSLPHRAPQAQRPIISGDAISRLAFAINSASLTPQASTATKR
jgi:hypothetical protein